MAEKTSRGNGDKDPAVLEREIDETRADVRATLEALEEKLSPGELLDHLMNLARRHGGGVVDSLGAAARENPVATLLASVGLAWLFSAARPVSESAHQPEPDAEALTAGEALTARDLGEEPPGVGSKLNRLVYEQPLVVGAIGVAVGAMLSVAIGPRRRPSDRARLLARGEAEFPSTARSHATPGTATAPDEERPAQPFSF